MKGFATYISSILVMLIIAGYFRFIGLGYSDLQGDEAKIFTFRNYASFSEFLFTNLKGPNQYIIAKFFDLVFVNSPLDLEFLFRLPFALAGFFSILLFFYLGKKFYSFETGIYAGILAALNGFFIAFARIIQYQSFIILLSLASSFFFLKFFDNGKKIYLILSSLISAVALLFHYDSLGFIAPQLAMLFLKNERVKNYSLYLLGFSTSLIFYLPYALSDRFTATLDYLIRDRAAGNFSYDSVLYSFKLSIIYLSKEYIFIVLLLVGILLWNLKIWDTLKYRIALIALALLLIARYFVGHPYKPLIGLSTLIGLGILYLIFTNKKLGDAIKYFLTWFLFVFIGYILVINKPLTHIYGVFIPMVLLVGYQLSQIKNKIIKYIICGVVLMFVGSFNYQAYIENKTEYPWVSEKYLGGQMYSGISEGEIVRGIFGFPYYRQLDLLQNDMSKLFGSDISPAFFSNIKAARLQFYLNQKYPPLPLVEKFYIDVKEDRDYEPESIDTSTAREKLGERDWYTIYKIP